MGDGTNSGPGPGGSSRRVPMRVLVGIGSLIVGASALIAWFVLLVTGDWSWWLSVLGFVALALAYFSAAKGSG